MIAFALLDWAEVEKEYERLWQEEFAPGRDPSIYRDAFPVVCRVTFRAHLYAAELELGRRGQLALFRKTQQLPDYRRAEDAIKRGWVLWLKNEFGLDSNQPIDYLTLHQRFLLYGIRCDQTRKARQERKRRSSKLLAESRARGDNKFSRKLSHDLAEPARKRQDYRESIYVLLANWLTAFWWLMPLNAVADQIAEVQGKPGEAAEIEKFYAHLRQITTRRTPPSRGAFFSRGWNEVFYSADPCLIECWQNGRPEFSTVGHRLLA